MSDAKLISREKLDELHSLLSELTQIPLNESFKITVDVESHNKLIITTTIADKKDGEFIIEDEAIKTLDITKEFETDFRIDRASKSSLKFLKEVAAFDNDKIKRIDLNFIVFSYGRIDDVSLVCIFGIPIYKKVGDLRSLFGFTYKIIPKLLA